jgi:hypothetical protein
VNENLKKPVLLLGMAVWVLFILISGKWSANPLIWGFQNKDQTFSIEQAAKIFPHHLMTIEISPMAGYSQTLLEDEPGSGDTFNLWKWAAEESRSRFLLTVPVWMGGGFFFLWFIHRERVAQQS